MLKLIPLLLLIGCTTKPTYKEIESFCDSVHFQNVENSRQEMVKSKFETKQYVDYQKALSEYDGCLFGIIEWEQSK